LVCQKGDLHNFFHNNNYEGIIAVYKSTIEAGEKMSLETIQKIAAIESEAEKQRTDALAEAKKIVADADSAGQEKLRLAKAAVEADVSKLCLEAETLGKAAADAIAARMRSQCAALESAASAKIDAAASIIVEKVVNG
jgi:V/A-type H+-transporting ATPase subunit G/H